MPAVTQDALRSAVDEAFAAVLKHGSGDQKPHGNRRGAKTQPEASHAEELKWMWQEEEPINLTRASALEDLTEADDWTPPGEYPGPEEQQKWREAAAEMQAEAMKPGTRDHKTLWRGEPTDREYAESLVDEYRRGQTVEWNRLKAFSPSREFATSYADPQFNPYMIAEGDEGWTVLYEIYEPKGVKYGWEVNADLETVMPAGLKVRSRGVDMVEAERLLVVRLGLAKEQDNLRSPAAIRKGPVQKNIRSGVDLVRAAFIQAIGKHGAGDQAPHGNWADGIQAEDTEAERAVRESYRTTKEYIEQLQAEHPEAAPFASDWPQDYEPVEDAPGQDLKPWKREGIGMDSYAEEVPVEFLLDKHGNAPKYTAARMQTFTDTIATNGIDEELILFVGTDDILYVGEGNHRLEAARALGWTHVPARLIMQSSTPGLGGVNRNMVNLLSGNKSPIKRGLSYIADSAPPHAYLDIPGIIPRDDITFDRYWNPKRVKVSGAELIKAAFSEAIAKHGSGDQSPHGNRDGSGQTGGSDSGQGGAYAIGDHVRLTEFEATGKIVDYEPGKNGAVDAYAIVPEGMEEGSIEPTWVLADEIEAVESEPAKAGYESVPSIWDLEETRVADKHQYMTEAYQPAVDSLDDLTQHALSGYQEGGYELVNGYLRHPELHPVSGERLASLEESISDLKSASRAGRAPQDMIAYRGMTMLPADIEGLDGLVGQVVSDAGFVSTTVTRDVALGFADEEMAAWRAMELEDITGTFEMGKPVLWEIGVRKGAPSLYLGKSKWDLDELLLPNGSEFAVQAVETMRDGTKTVYAMLILPGEAQ